jgi:light-harvesting complex 1 beta chain
MPEMFNQSAPSVPRESLVGFLLIFAPCYFFLLAVAVLGQLVGIHWRTWLSGAENSQNILSGIKAAVYTFMSHII